MSETLFVAYHPNDAAAAAELSAQLSQHGFTVQQNIGNIRQGDQPLEQLLEALCPVDRLIMLLSPAAIQSCDLFYTWFAFYRARKPIHCLMLEKCAVHHQLQPFGYLPWQNSAQRDYQKLFALLSEPFAAPEYQVVVSSPFAPERTWRQSMNALLETIRAEDDSLALRPEQIEEIRSQPPLNEQEYLLTRYIYWCAPRFALHEQFIQLSLLVDEGDDRPHYVMYGIRQYTDLRAALHQADSPAVVVLGLPGSGKSTLLSRLEMETALNALRQSNSRYTLPFYVSLADYGINPDQPLPNPMDWLAGLWQIRAPNLPSLPTLLAERRVLLLLDGLNEMPHKSPEDYRQRLSLWRSFLHQHIFGLYGNRAVFTCRTIDYSEGLSHPTYRVQQFHIQPLSAEQRRRYLQVYAPERAEALSAALDRNPELRELFRSPFLLKLLVELFDERESLPLGRAHTFTRLIRKLLRREIESGTQIIANSPLLSPAARQILRTNARIDEPYYLPDQKEEALLLAALRSFAYTLQRTYPGQRAVRVLYQNAVSLIEEAPPERREDVLRGGIAINALELDHREFKVYFFHHLLQEYFAARLLARNPQPHLARSEWRSQHMQPSLAEVISKLAPSEPLPPPPSTGWEVCMILAAAMTEDQEQFVRDLIAPNLPLAAYCAAAPDVKVSPALRAELTERLIARCSDPEADLRARIAAAKALGDLGDPRFVPQGGSVRYIVPPLIAIRGGEYHIGSTEAEDEQPIHTVFIADFQIGQFPVTNAEYRLFIEAGGYEDSRWWRTEAAERWRSGAETYELDKAAWRARIAERRAMLRDGRLQAQLERGEITQAQFESRKRLAELSDAEFEAELESWYPKGKRTAPLYWEDTRFNAPTQPVVGVTWYEAQAYCAWLAYHSGLRVRLPTEAEREIATRGAAMRRYAYGDDPNPECANTAETRIGVTTPIGIFPCGATPEGVHDLSGNLWEWTSSLYRPYPYRADDGREDESVPDAFRVVRGGSWYHRAFQARGAYRGALYRPYHANDNVGFRIVVG
ncbi:MAG: SUMF1/EgtB/PvdO family nonheme iron enzyme [Anaerolineae bacterium]|nr:SUMF1/EgtB/PvdO family nonheme iron enzyme [Anaerolineae bacterium]